MPALPVETLTERFEASQQDKAIVAELCHRLGFEPAHVNALTFRVARDGHLVVEVTRRADAPADPNRRLLQPVPTV